MNRLKLAPPRWILASLASLASVCAYAQAGEFKIGERTFHLADGFVIERIAGPPIVDRPITAALDETGALYVADSSGSNDNVKKQLADKPHRIVRLIDTNGDGIYDRQTVFADRMMFPEGTMWLAGSLYVSAPPSIWKLTDRDGDGVAEDRVEWYQGKTLTGCANDLHGPYAGPDGWIYWCKGAFAEQTHERPGRAPLVSRAAHIFRSRRDGSGIEPVMTGGMDNPVDVVFTPGGERLFTTTFLVRPGGGQRDGLIHAIYGGVYGKIHDSIFDRVHPWTGPEVMPVLLHMGPAAPCGFTRYESSVFGDAYRDNLFACYFNLHKVSRHVLRPRGASFVTQDEDFLKSPDVDFHPTDVFEDGTGGLIVVDTGGWYKLCCPTSQLHKPDILGAVYRITRVGAARPKPVPADFKPTLDDLDEPRPPARRRAIELLAAAPGIVPRLTLDQAGNRSPLWRTGAVWTLCRIEGEPARAAVRGYLGDRDETVRQTAIHAVSLWRDKAAVSALVAMLEGRSAQNARAAAEALGRIGDSSAVPALLDACGKTNERILEHSLTYALIEIGDAQAVTRGLAAANPSIVRAAMVALDNIPGSGLEPRFVAGLLTSPDPALKAAASWIVGRRPEWGTALAGVLGERIDRADLPASERKELETQLGRLAHAPAIQELLAARLSQKTTPAAVQASALHAMAQARFKEQETPPRWIESLAEALRPERRASLADDIVATCRSLPIPRDKGQILVAPLQSLADESNESPALRASALAAVPGGLDSPRTSLFSFLLSALNPEQPTAVRSTAADVLARARLSTAQLAKLSDSLENAGPLELDRLLFAYEQASDDPTGLTLVARLTGAKAFGSLRADALRTHLAKYGPRVQEAMKPLVARLNVDADKQRARLDQLAANLAQGDIRRGQRVFMGDKASCYACHAIGYRGGDVGPDLTRIGKVRTDRDLLEAILYPSASFVRSFEPVVIATSDGKSVNGLIRGESADEIILATGVNQTVHLPRKDIEDMTPSKVSVMPAGLDQQLSPQELADLVAFLRACR